MVEAARKRELLSHLVRKNNWEQVLVFCKTKHGSNRLASQLQKDRINADAIHGNKSQSARIRALEDFKAGKVKVLVATDIAARGLDIEELPHVVNFDLPHVPEDYVHRIGRTGRAGSTGRRSPWCARRIVRCCPPSSGSSTRRSRCARPTDSIVDPIVASAPHPRRSRNDRNNTVARSSTSRGSTRRSSTNRGTHRARAEAARAEARAPRAAAAEARAAAGFLLEAVRTVALRAGTRCVARGSGTQAPGHPCSGALPQESGVIRAGAFLRAER
jgi:ATP-dependent RNA helicase RhlE